MSGEEGVPVAVSVDIVLADGGHGIISRQLKEIMDSDGALVIGLHVSDEVVEGAEGVLKTMLVGSHVGHSKDDLLGMLKEVVAILENGAMIAENPDADAEGIEKMLAEPMVWPERMPIVDGPPVP